MSQMTFMQLCELFNYIPKNRLLHSHEVAELLGISVRTIQNWRQTGEGPRYFSPNGTRRCWYAEREVLTWMASGEKRSTSEAA